MIGIQDWTLQGWRVWGLTTKFSTSGGVRGGSNAKRKISPQTQPVALYFVTTNHNNHLVYRY